VASSIYQDRKDEGLELWVVLGETGQYTQPDLEYCMAYAESHSISPENVYLDYNPESLNPAWDVLFANVSPMVTDIGLPWSAIIEGGEMMYVWNSAQPNAGSAESAFDEYLGE